MFRLNRLLNWDLILIISEIEVRENKIAIFWKVLSTQQVRMDSLIFEEPLFIRRNILLNFLFSKFKTEEFSENSSTVNFPDVLRAIYHNLMPVNISEDRKHALTFIYNVLMTKSEECEDIDWMYIERTLIHFVNLENPNTVDFLLSRRTSAYEYQRPSNPQ